MERLWRFIVEQFVFNPVVQGAFAILFAIFVAVSWSDQAADQAWLKQFNQASQVTLSSLADRNNGELVVFDAIVANQNPLVDGEFVASITEHYEQDLVGNATTWREQGRITPRLWLQDHSDTIQLANEDWLPNLVHERRDAEPTAFEGAKRTRGLLPGDQVSVLGRVQQGNELQVEALRVYPGDTAALRQELESMVGINGLLFNISLVLLLISTVLTAIGIRRFWADLQQEGKQAS